jgi:hypothetical protein
VLQRKSFEKTAKVAQKVAHRYFINRDQAAPFFSHRSNLPNSFRLDSLAVLKYRNHYSFKHETNRNKVVRSLLNRPNGEGRIAERISSQREWKTTGTS